jgi:hypothetical protein
VPQCPPWVRFRDISGRNNGHRKSPLTRSGQSVWLELTIPRQIVPNVRSQFSIGGNARMARGSSRTGTCMARPPRAAAADNPARTHMARRYEDSSRTGHDESRDRKSRGRA